MGLFKDRNIAYSILKKQKKYLIGRNPINYLTISKKLRLES